MFTYDESKPSLMKQIIGTKHMMQTIVSTVLVMESHEEWTELHINAIVIAQFEGHFVKARFIM